MADFPSSTPSSEEESKKKMKLDHEEQGLHHAAAAASLGAISSSASNHGAESAAGDAVLGPEFDDDDPYAGSEIIARDDSSGDEEVDEGGHVRDRPAKDIRDTLDDRRKKMYDDFKEHVAQSGGFDVEVKGIPLWLQNQVMRPINLEDKFFGSRLKEMCERACESANSIQTEQRLEFKKVLKANLQNVMWFRYYITFAAIDKLDKSDGPNGKEKVYQAIVYAVDFIDEYQLMVEMVRPKPPIDYGAAAAPDV
ncbi:hypothetical protein Tsubulata_049451 [Turnera subulata]|uniref:Uncharacterized protein n=1 Tax=Turnera subulata TaxID=218843 RepID=A0A9Q0FQQ3_9ROSI|nr:hypothetical protein Tsubulata_049451 [Turnera subulata]